MTQENETRSGSKEAVRRMGRTGVRIRPGARRVAIAEGLFLEWKNPGRPEDLGLEVEHLAGVAGGIVRIATPLIPGWIRLVMTPPAAGARGVLGARLLLRVHPAGDARREKVRPILAVTRDDTRQGIGHCSTDLPLQADVWHELRGLFAVHPDEEDVQFLLNLPKGCTIDIAAADVEWLPADISGALAARLADRLAEPVRDLSALPVSDADLAARQAAPAVYAVEVAPEGLTLRGWVLHGAGDGAQVLALSGDRQSAGAARARVEPLEGLGVAGGFELPLIGLAGGDDERLRLHLDDGRGGADDGLLLHEAELPALLRPRRRRGKDGQGATRLFYFPDYTATNPYQALMYRNMPHYRAEPGDVDAALAAQEDAPEGQEVVLHLHWLNPVLAGARNVWQAREKADAFLEKLSFFVHRGGVVLWTVHNLVSHSPVFRDVEVALGQGVADLAARIHVHSRRLLPELASCYRLEEAKLVIEPHPNYIGYYPDYIDAARARAHLGLAAEARVFLFFGQLRPYKGIERLVRAFQEIQQEVENAHLLIVGAPVHPFSRGMLERRYEGVPNVHVIEGHVPDDRLQWYYNAADWVVLPYNAVLTSGSLLGAFSFARPVIAPDLGMIGDLLEIGRNGILYDPQDEGALRDSLLAAAQTGARELEALSANAIETVRPLTWKRMGEGLEAALEQAPGGTAVEIGFDDGARECLLLGRPFPPERPARTAIVILNYRHLEDVRRLVDSLEESDDRDFDIYLVDNASPNLSASDLAVAFPQLHVLRLPENMGYAAGNNAALRLIDGLDYEFVWILNPDMVVSPDALSRHVAAAGAMPETSIFGPVILRGGNDRRIASAGSWIRHDDGLATGHMYAGMSPSVLPETPYKVDFITGASVFLRKSVLERIGLMPEDYFLYFEETHWLLEAGRRGEACVVVPDIRLAHHKRSEEGGLPARYYFYYYLRNSLLFAARMGKGDVAATLTGLRTGFIAAWLKRIEKAAPDKLALYRHLAERALADGQEGRSGPVDLIALELGAEGYAPLPDDTPMHAVIGQEQDRLEGLVELGPQAGRPRQLVLVTEDGIVARAPLERMAAGQFRFRATLPAALHDGAPHRLRFYVDASPLPEPVIDIRLPCAPRRVKARIDGIRQYVCTGWAFDRANPGDRLAVELLEDGEVVGHGVADVLRPDLRRAGLGDGRAGFRIRLPRRFSDGRKHHLELRLAGTDRTLSERDVLDGEIAGGAQPVPVPEALRRIYHHRQIWLARHPLRELPLWHYLDQARAEFARRHAGRHEDVLATVIMPAYNRAEEIGEAIASVRAQTHENWELLIVDDGSADATAETVRAFIEESGDARIRLIELATNRGVSAARNAGLAQARGEVIAYLDSDNDWEPEFLAIMVGELMDQPEDVQGAYCAQNILHVLAPGSADAPAIKERIAIRLGAWCAPLMENRNFIDLNCFVHRRRASEELGGFNEKMRRLVDWDLIARLTWNGGAHHVPALLSNYYFEKSDNQITRLENHGESLDEMRESLRRLRNTPRPGPDPEIAPVDMVLFGDGIESGLAARVDDLLRNADPAADVRLIVHAGAEALAELRADPIAADPRLVLREVAGAEEDADEERPAGFPMGACLDDALAERREGADLVLLQARAFPARGWLSDFARAHAACPEGGMFVSRHVVPGNDRRVEAHVPFASRDLEVCIAISAVRDNVLDPVLERRENLVELSGFEPFCTMIPADVAARLGGVERAETSLEVALRPLVDFTRLFLGRKLVYCGNVRVREMPVI